MSELNSKLFNYSIYLLARRDYSKKEMLKKFKEKEYSPTDIEAVMDYLITNGYQSDHKFTRAYINAKLGAKVGLSKIKRQLSFDKGITNEIIEDVLSEFDIDETENIIRFLETKYRNKDLKDPKEKNKAFRFLVSKGFSFDDIKQSFIKHAENQST